ncbi:MAG: GHKL domain-containing protein [Oscillospiraceae bacterium]|nr:GHKL domain-containing protein [Oscillospiraceae bacterium]
MKMFILMRLRKLYNFWESKQKQQWIPMLVMMGIVFSANTVAILLLNAFVDHLNNDDLMIRVAYLYRIPLVALICVLPQGLYFKAMSIPVVELTPRGVMHLILTTGAAYWGLYHFNWVVQQHPVAMIFVILILYIFVRVIAVNVYFYVAMYVVAKKSAELELQHREVEHERLLFYVGELERQQLTSRKFRHDYQNLLFTFDIFIQEQDWAGLKHFYETKLRAASENVLKHGIAIEGMNKIKIKEIKGILSAKLIEAANSGVNVKFEVDGEIEEIAADSIVLVRMLGIIYDNAIEALKQLGGGILLAGCYQVGNGVTFVVQNNCPPETPPIFKLKQAGFSTKGEGRGMGLANLSELADSQPNIVVNTSVAQEVFIQKIRVGTEDEYELV